MQQSTKFGVTRVQQKKHVNYTVHVDGSLRGYDSM
jgi:hypothetical protein